MKKSIITLCLYLAPFTLAIFASSAVSAKSLPLNKLNLPEGFSISIFAEVENARQMTLGPNGTIYVGSRKEGKVYALIDKDGDFSVETVITIAEDLNLPSGVAMKDGNLYVGAVDQILLYKDIDAGLGSHPSPEIIIDSLPDKRHHGWKYLEFGPDGLLYIPVGAPCNICLSEAPFASILRTDVRAEKIELETFASGVRNTVGFDWHPLTKELWFTDNGRDLMGDDIPPCELNHAPKTGLHFGYPYVHGKDIRDPEFGSKEFGKDQDGKDLGLENYVAPALELDPHVAPLGMMFYSGNQFPARYHNQILIPEHGSWNRTVEAGHTGHRIMLASFKENGQMDYEVFIDGWLQDNKAWGRPVDIIQLPDGSILISDDTADVIYRVTYKM
jgi:glucose/arabinose dehydrogenase